MLRTVCRRKMTESADFVNFPVKPANLATSVQRRYHVGIASVRPFAALAIWQDLTDRMKIRL